VVPSMLISNVESCTICVRTCLNPISEVAVTVGLLILWRKKKRELMIRLFVFKR
jgi:hypothetical protein